MDPIKFVPPDPEVFEEWKKEQKKLVEAAQARSRAAYEFDHGHPPIGDLIEKCDVDLNDAEDNARWDSVWDTIAAREMAERYLNQRKSGS